MKILNTKKVTFFLLSFFLFLCPLTVKATNANVSFSGNNSVYNGNTIDITLVISESGSKNDEGISGIQGPISYDTSKLELISTKSHSLNVNYNSGKIVGMVTSQAEYLRGTKNVITFTFKAKALGSANVSIKADVSDADGKKIFSNNVSKTISITNPPSSNNNLSSLSVSNSSINFNKNNTNYSVSVDSNVTNITISATSEDSGASITGIGTKNLNYGNNQFYIVVTAPSGDKKTYAITVNRKDNRSGNNKLASLSVNGAELSPKFNANTDSYSVSVPYNISNLKVNAKAEDEKAKINITNTNLTAEGTTDVKIVVTAENGSTKTYTIHATRGKDPNKVLSTNNNLSSLTVSTGTLSPSFNKEQTKYIVYLPYEVDSIQFETVVEDIKYAKVKIEGPDKLNVGNNNYKILVTAEDNSIKEYTVIVARGNNLLETTLSSNTNIKEIKFKNGSLVGKIDSTKREYSYKKYKNFKIEKVVLEDENSTVNVIEEGKTIYLLVTSASGEYDIYTLRVQEFSIMNIIVYLLIFLLGMVFGISTMLFMKKVVKKKKDNSKNDSEMKSKTKNKKIKKKKEIKQTKVDA